MLPRRDCKAGFQKTGGSCVACAAGKFKDAGNLTANDTQAAGVCRPCTEACPLKGYFISTACQPTQDIVCSPCSTRCQPGYYQRAQCSATADLQCVACTVNCSAGSYHANGLQCDGASTADTVLAGCARCRSPDSCQAGVSYLPDGQCPGTTSMDAACVACTQDVTCPAGYFRTGCDGNSTMDYHCQAYTACPAGVQYLSGYGPTKGGRCVACSPTCDAQGLREISPCGQYADAVCGGQTCGPSRPCNMSLGSQLYCQYYSSEDGYCMPCPVRLACFGSAGPVLDASSLAGGLRERRRAVRGVPRAVDVHGERGGGVPRGVRPGHEPHVRVRLGAVRPGVPRDGGGPERGAAAGALPDDAGRRVVRALLRLQGRLLYAGNGPKMLLSLLSRFV